MFTEPLHGDQLSKSLKKKTIFLQENGHQVWGNNVPKYYEAGSTRYLQKRGGKRGGGGGIRKGNVGDRKS